MHEIKLRWRNSQTTDADEFYKSGHFRRGERQKTRQSVVKAVTDGALVGGGAAWCGASLTGESKV